MGILCSRFIREIFQNLVLHQNNYILNFHELINNLIHNSTDNGMCVFDSYNNNSCEESYYSGPSGKCQDFKEDECGGEAINPIWPCCKWIGNI